MPSPLSSLRDRLSRRFVAGALLVSGLLAGGVVAQTGAASAHSGAGATTSRGAGAALPVRMSLHTASARTRQASKSASTAATSTQPLGPGQMRRAYGLPARGAPGQTVAIVSAYNDPDAGSDLNAYDSYYNLPRCTTSNHCLRILNQHGKPSPLPGADVSGGTWTSESAGGIEVVHGICNSCKILLVEASGPDRADFSEAVKSAADAGAGVIVTTFTISEDEQFDPRYAPDYRQPKAVVVAAAGDAGVGSDYGYFGGTNFPSSLPDVLAVGGTHLDTGRGGVYHDEVVWSQTVSGCSGFEPAAKWQRAIAKSVGCQSRRAVADLAAQADPGAVVHVSNSGIPNGPWFAETGTSLSAPIVGAMIGLAGSQGSHEVQMIYAHGKAARGAFHDITHGNDGCSTRICQAGRGFDGPTGWGTPDGLAAFLPSGGALDRKRPGVTLVVPRRGLRASRSWHVSFAVRNGNPFRVSANLSLRQRLLVGGRWRTVRFAGGRTAVGPRSTETVTLTIDKHDRALLRHLKRTQADLWMFARGPARPTVKVSRTVTLLAP